jgi:hypothetical protein
MNITAYLSLVDTAAAELAKVRTKLEQYQARIGGARCAPVFASPINWGCDGVGIDLMPDELQAAFDNWLAVIGDRLAHPPGDDA